mmetsp:Transcript_28482/g.65820  ORF Transcript_28482/g.65820 Transcript_28482/m.65820 type:complete len:226 (+) Transcript_28482:1236-1913(+)
MHEEVSQDVFKVPFSQGTGLAERAPRSCHSDADTQSAQCLAQNPALESHCRHYQVLSALHHLLCLCRMSITFEYQLSLDARCLAGSKLWHHYGPDLYHRRVSLPITASSRHDHLHLWWADAVLHMSRRRQRHRYSFLDWCTHQHRTRLVPQVSGLCDPAGVHWWYAGQVNMGTANSWSSQNKRPLHREGVKTAWTSAGQGSNSVWWTRLANICLGRSAGPISIAM